nr:diguanylate cyclase [Legionella pneumophila]
MLCFPFTELDDGNTMCERIRSGLEAITINDNNESLIQITASFGLTLLNSQRSVEESIKNADKALYLAKAEGRNCVRIWK